MVLKCNGSCPYERGKEKADTQKRKQTTEAAVAAMWPQVTLEERRDRKILP